MFQLVLNLGHALVPGTFICRVHTQVGHDFTFRGEFLQRLFPVFTVLGQKVLIDGAGGGVDTPVILRVIKQFLTGGGFIRIRLVPELLQLTLQAGDFGIKARNFPGFRFQKPDLTEKIVICHAVLEPRTFLQFV